MTIENILNVTEADFEYEVLSYSRNVPVLVDFWATWCQPCKILSPTLEKLTRDANGAFRLAKVDIDQNPNLALMFNVRSIPTVKAFSQGQVVGEFLGAQPEQRIKEFILKIKPPSQLDLELEKANSILSSHQWEQAEKIFLSILDQNPDSDPAIKGLAKSILAQGKYEQFFEIIPRIKSIRDQSQVQVLIPLAKAIQAYQQGNLPEQNDLDFAFNNCIRLVLKGNHPAALDGLLDLLRLDKHYRNDLARKVFLSIIDLLGEGNTTARQYRSELASVLF